MTSSDEDGAAAAAAAADQLGSMSLGEKSVERKGESNEDAEENNEAPAKLCSACATKSDTLMKCTACKCVWYCNKECQNKHWKEHKKQCKLIKKELGKRGGKLDVGTELDAGPLGELPPREECSICMQVLPIHESLHTYFPCCGKIICCGCDYQHSMKSGKGRTCAFCREPLPKSDDENLARLSKRVELKDPVALSNMALVHGFGEFGLPVDQARCIELLRESSDLGSASAQYQLGVFYCAGEMGLEQNEEEAIKYTEKAAEGGYLLARYNLGAAEHNKGNRAGAMRHLRLSAAGGLKESIHDLIEYFEDGLLHHEDLAETMQTFYRVRGELKSEERDQHIAYLKRTGGYQDDMVL